MQAASSRSTFFCLMTNSIRLVIVDVRVYGEEKKEEMRLMVNFQLLLFSHV